MLRTTLALVLIGAGPRAPHQGRPWHPHLGAGPVPARRGDPVDRDDGAGPARARGQGSRCRRRAAGTPCCEPMMVVMTPEATPAQIDAVVAKLEARGVHAKVMPGELTTAIGAIGDPEGVRELGLEGLPGVDQVIPISRPYKLASSELSHHAPTSFAVDGRVVGGGGTFCLIAGPCTVETPEQTLDGRAGGRGRRRLDAARRRLQAAHLAVLVPGAGWRGPLDPALGARGDRPAGGERADLDRARRPVRRLGRRDPGGRAQHAELRPARGGGQDGQARAAEARPLLDARRAAAGGGLRAQGGQRARDPVRARHPDLRAGDALHARPRRRALAQAPHPPARDRRPLARVRRPPPGRPALARRGGRGRGRHHRRGGRRPRGGAVRRAAAALRA